MWHTPTPQRRQAEFPFISETFTTSRACISQQPTDNVPPSQQNLLAPLAPSSAACLLAAQATKTTAKASHKYVDLQADHNHNLRLAHWTAHQTVDVIKESELPSISKASLLQGPATGHSPYAESQSGQTRVGTPKTRTPGQVPCKMLMQPHGWGCTWRRPA